MTKGKQSGGWSRVCAPTMTANTAVSPLDCPCYMLGKWWTGSLCRYFRAAVLPLAPVLETALTGEAAGPEIKRCAVCGRAFIPEGRQAYCSGSLQGRGQPPPEPGAYAEKAAEKQGAALRLGPVKPLCFRAFFARFERS